MTDTPLSLYFVPGGAMTGEIAGEKIEVIDDNIDGVYGRSPSAGSTSGWSRTRSARVRPVRIGGAKKAQPFSEYVNMGELGWYKLEALNGASS